MTGQIGRTGVFHGGAPADARHATHAAATASARDAAQAARDATRDAAHVASPSSDRNGPRWQCFSMAMDETIDCAGHALTHCRHVLYRIDPWCGRAGGRADGTPDCRKRAGGAAAEKACKFARSAAVGACEPDAWPPDWPTVRATADLLGTAHFQLPGPMRAGLAPHEPRESMDKHGPPAAAMAAGGPAAPERAGVFAHELPCRASKRPPF